MNKIKALFKNIFFINLLIVLGLTAVGAWGVNYWLHASTCQDCEITVPDFTGLKEEAAIKMAQERDLRLTVEDTVYMKRFPKNTFVDQKPAPLAKVKEGRTIYLSINANTPPKAKIKDLTDMPARNAVRILENDGFLVDDEFEYEPSPALNWVLKVKHKDEEIEWGTKLEKGSKLVLVVGNGLNDGNLTAPTVVGQPYSTLKTFLRLQGRVLGKMDTTGLGRQSVETSVVYKQKPKPGEEIKPSTPINVWLTDSNTFNLFYRNKLDSINNTLKR